MFHSPSRTHQRHMFVQPRGAPMYLQRSHIPLRQVKSSRSHVVLTSCDGLCQGRTGPKSNSDRRHGHAQGLPQGKLKETHTHTQRETHTHTYCIQTRISGSEACRSASIRSEMLPSCPRVLQDSCPRRSQRQQDSQERMLNIRCEPHGQKLQIHSLVAFQ